MKGLQAFCSLRKSSPGTSNKRLRQVRWNFSCLTCNSLIFVSLCSLSIHCYFCKHLRVERFIPLWGFLRLAVIVWLGSSCSVKETSLCTCSASSLLSQLLTEQVKARHPILCTFFSLGNLSQVEPKKGTSEELIILTGVSLKLIFLWYSRFWD